MNSSKIIKFACLSIIGAISMVQAEQSTSDPKPATYHESIPTPTFQNIRYGEYERNVLDFWKAESEQPTPLVIVIHGGGWCVGSKEKLHEIIDPKPLLKNGISVAAINYRLIGWKMKDLKVTPRVKAPMHDAALAVQFLRSKAEEWNINKELVAATGASAGACTSLWLAYHDDLADPLNDNPVKHESTRLFCVAAKGAQTTLDPVQAREWIPNNKYGSIAFGAKGFYQFLMEARPPPSPCTTYSAWTFRQRSRRCR
ncbi:MAG: alpha/beta hydrolase [Verrucomicrobiota bacterium]